MSSMTAAVAAAIKRVDFSGWIAEARTLAREGEARIKGKLEKVYDWQRRTNYPESSIPPEANRVITADQRKLAATMREYHAKREPATREALAALVADAEATGRAHVEAHDRLRAFQAEAFPAYEATTAFTRT